MRWAFVQKENDLKENEDESKFNETKFDDQFLRFSQILDTDYTSYMVVYSCQENAEWFDDRSGLEIAPEQVWQASINQRNHYSNKNKKKPASIYDGKNFENTKGIRTDWIHKQKIQIYTRPKFHPETREYKFQRFDNLRLQTILNDVSTKYLESEFGQHILDDQYAKMVHDETCDYNPYDNLEYYNIHHDEPETKEQLKEHIQGVKEDEHKKMTLEHDEVNEMHDEL